MSAVKASWVIGRGSEESCQYCTFCHGGENVPKGQELVNNSGVFFLLRHFNRFILIRRVQQLKKFFSGQTF